jgi:hypothetical protein
MLKVERGTLNRAILPQRSAFILPHSGHSPTQARDDAQRAERAGDRQRPVTIDAATAQGLAAWRQAVGR